MEGAGDRGASVRSLMRAYEAAATRRGRQARLHQGHQRAPESVPEGQDGRALDELAVHLRVAVRLALLWFSTDAAVWPTSTVCAIGCSTTPSRPTSSTTTPRPCPSAVSLRWPLSARPSLIRTKIDRPVPCRLSQFSAPVHACLRGLASFCVSLRCSGGLPHLRLPRSPRVAAHPRSSGTAHGEARSEHRMARLCPLICLACVQRSSVPPSLVPLRLCASIALSSFDEVEPLTLRCATDHRRPHPWRPTRRRPSGPTTFARWLGPPCRRSSSHRPSRSIRRPRRPRQHPRSSRRSPAISTASSSMRRPGPSPSTGITSSASSARPKMCAVARESSI